MKKMVFGLLVVIGLTGIVGLRSASAQDTPALVNVPFAFIVGNKVLPAGSYRIVADVQDPSLLLVENTNPRVNAAAAFAATEWAPNPNPQDPHVQVAFKNVDGHMFLWRVAMPASDAHYIPLNKAEAERRLAALNLMPAEPAATDSGR